MKLGWMLVEQPDKLWVRVLRTKYGCGESAIPSIKPSQKASHIWRGIQKVWHDVEKGLRWAVQDGNRTRFWQDVWIPECGKLQDHCRF